MPFKDAAAQSAYHQQHADEGRERARAWYAQHRDRALARQRRYRARNPRAIAASNQRWRESNRAVVLWARARSRAKSRGIEFAIDRGDVVIPSHCPVLGIPILNGGAPDNAPSLDRVDNARGYVKGNVVVVSWRANRLKSDATRAELLAVATFYAATGS